MRAGAGGLARGLRPDREHGVDVAGLDGVVHQARALGPVLRAQRRDDGLVEQPHAGHREAALDRAPRQLVAEAEAVGADLRSRRPARPRAARERRRRAAARPARAATCEGTTDRRSSASRQSGSSAAQAGEHRVLDAGRHLVGRRGERLGDEERVAARQRVDGGRRRARCRAASACTASRDSGDSSMRCTGQPASAPSSRCSGWRGSSSSRGRQDQHRADGARRGAPRSRARRGWRRRPSGRPRRRGRSGAPRRAPPAARRRRDRPGRRRPARPPAGRRCRPPRRAAARACARRRGRRTPP